MTQSNMPDVLKPCPFCGENPTRRISNDILIVECQQCVSIGFHNHVQFGCRADLEWNTRHIVAAPSPWTDPKVMPIPEWLNSRAELYIKFIAWDDSETRETAFAVDARRLQTKCKLLGYVILPE